MTDNQERAYAELATYQEHKSKIRVLELKRQTALDDAGIKSAWPDVGVVPGIKAKHPAKDSYTRQVDPNLYATLERGASDPEQKIIKAIHKRDKLNAEILELNNKIKGLESKINQRCDYLEAEVLIRRFFFDQYWSTIAEDMMQSRPAIKRLYYEGLEKFGED